MNDLIPPISLKLLYTNVGPVDLDILFKIL